MPSHYPPYGGNASEASFDHVARGGDDYTNSTTNLAGGHGEKSGALGAGGFKGKMASSNGGRNNTKKWIIAGVVAGVVVIGAVLGGVLGTQLNKDTSTTSSSSNGVAANDAAIKVVAASTSTAKDGSVKTISSTSTSAPSSTSSPAAAVASVSPLPEWKWTQSAFAAAASSGQGEPMWGAALGNWLILEQWMDEPCEHTLQLLRVKLNPCTDKQKQGSTRHLARAMAQFEMNGLSCKSWVIMLVLP
jgi:hypothetical protein